MWRAASQLIRGQHTRIAHALRNSAKNAQHCAPGGDSCFIVIRSESVGLPETIEVFRIQRQRLFLLHALQAQPCNRCGAERATGRTPINTDALWTICLQQFAIHSGDIFAGRRKAMLRRKSIVHRDHLDAAETRDRYGFRCATRTATAEQERSSMKVDENPVLVLRRDPVLRYMSMFMTGTTQLLVDGGVAA